MYNLPKIVTAVKFKELDTSDIWCINVLGKYSLGLFIELDDKKVVGEANLAKRGKKKVKDK